MATGLSHCEMGYGKLGFAHTFAQQSCCLLLVQNWVYGWESDPILAVSCPDDIMNRQLCEVHPLHVYQTACFKNPGSQAEERSAGLLLNSQMHSVTCCTFVQCIRWYCRFLRKQLWDICEEKFFVEEYLLIEFTSHEPIGCCAQRNELSSDLKE